MKVGLPRVYNGYLAVLELCGWICGNAGLVCGERRMNDGYD
jgi:hypothetical protein